jgi:protein transport protein SEC31
MRSLMPCCSPNLLASGGADGELCIWDVGNPAQPSLYPAMKGGAGAQAGQQLLCPHHCRHAVGWVAMLERKPEHRQLYACHLAITPAPPGPPVPACACPAAGPQPEITHLAWNRKVQHILGTCTAAGTVVVWDLKKQRPVISFKDPSGWVGLGVEWRCG